MATACQGWSQNYSIQSIEPGVAINLPIAQHYRYITNQPTMTKIAQIVVSYKGCLEEVEMRNIQADELRQKIFLLQQALDKSKETKNIFEKIDTIATKMNRKQAIKAWFQNAWKTIVIVFASAIIVAETSYIIVNQL